MTPIRLRHVLLLALAALILIGCRPVVTSPAEVTPPPVKILPDVKVALLKYHLPKYLRSTPRSAPLLDAENHPHGWEKPDCASCHELAPQAPMDDCAGCHGFNGAREDPEDCVTCHQVENEDRLHVAHVRSPSRDVACADCHPDAREGVSHANGVKDVLLATGTHVLAVGMSAEAPHTTRTCADTGCHTEREWDTESCLECHAYPPATGLHATHLTGHDGYRLDVMCESCHQGYDHESGEVNIAGFEEYDSYTGTCTTSCHADIEREEPVAEVETWDCAGCHDFPLDTGNHDVSAHVENGCATCHSGHNHSGIVTEVGLGIGDAIAEVRMESHGRFADGTCTTPCHEQVTWGDSCSDCHGYPPGTGSHPYHVQEEGLRCRDCHGFNEHDGSVERGIIDVSGDFAYDRTQGTCATDCHQEATSDYWGCETCHDYPPDTANHVSHAEPSGKYWDISDRVEAAGDGPVVGCVECHSDHTHSARAADPQAGALTAVVTLREGVFVADTERCNTACHSPFSWQETCDSCHAAPPGIGDHAVHIADDAINCGTCHTSSLHDLSDATPIGSITGGAVEISGMDTMTGSCSTTCHVNDAGRREVQYWDCASCHDLPPSTGAHPIHVEYDISCGVCHMDHEHSSAAAEQPPDLTKASVQFSARGSYAAGTQTCSNIGCHRDIGWMAVSEERGVR
ncbi:hypothetical protein HOI71_13640 [Candidatus Poribacteria bacterium]|nr:hypothetical protein [Candidatus Poribacteria bacterium]